MYNTVKSYALNMWQRVDIKNLTDTINPIRYCIQSVTNKSDKQIKLPESGNEMCIEGKFEKKFREAMSHITQTYSGNYVTVSVAFIVMQNEIYQDDYFTLMTILGILNSNRSIKGFDKLANWSPMCFHLRLGDFQFSWCYNSGVIISNYRDEGVIPQLIFPITAGNETDKVKITNESINKMSELLYLRMFNDDIGVYDCVDSLTFVQELLQCLGLVLDLGKFSESVYYKYLSERKENPDRLMFLIDESGIKINFETHKSLDKYHEENKQKVSKEVETLLVMLHSLFNLKEYSIESSYKKNLMCDYVKTDIISICT